MKYEIKETNRVEEVLFEGKVNLKIRYFWDSHGNLVDFANEKGNKTFSKKNVDVKIVKVNSQLNGVEFENWDIYVDGKKMNGSIYRYSYNPDTNNLNVKLVLGWG